MAKRKPRKLSGPRIEPPRLAPYGLADTTCAPIASKHRVRVCVTRPKKPGETVTGPDDVCHFLRGAIKADRESFYALHLDAGNRVIGIEEVSKGGLSSVEVHPREVFKAAVVGNAAAIIVAHNHPSGDPTPSPDDFKVTERLIEAGNQLGIPVRDSIVVAERGCVSLRSRMPSAEFGSSRWRAALKKRKDRKPR